ncbi:hypothetical protein P4U03_27810 [Bacillus mycoides]|uniref:Uncharacterized protein n=1 Tax=Bacillus thuringiensis serovar navarrensis TaxID=339658 RepID=A0A243A7S5_BACTU|nr:MULTISPECIES: hypothetical protein [Bacillus cereus group]MED1270295.1 hypothetical protein [Bacillus mycoides]OTY13649.1 hypothetical protein BK732_20330 [Bacillus thuringiensis serovar navarrensis]
MFTIENYTNSLKKGLEEKSDDLIRNIKETLQFNYYEGIDILDFTVFVQSFEMSVVMFSMDRGANEVFYEGKDSSVFSGSHDLIDDVEYYKFHDDEADEFWEFYEENDEALSEIETKAIVEWFAMCWNKAGGTSVKLPSYFSFHDYDECFDLHNSKWISDGDKWFD